MKITDKLKNEVLTYWRDTVKDKEALARTCDLFGLSEEDVKRILAVRWNEKPKFWTDERIFRLKAYMAQGMSNAEIANQLGCKPQAVADFKRRRKDILALYENENVAKLDKVIVSADDGKKKEPSVAGTSESSKKNTISMVGSSADDYITNKKDCQDTASDVGDDDITPEMYTDLYNKYLEKWNEVETASDKLNDVQLLLRTAKYAGIQWCEEHDSFGNELADCCRMFDMLISKALDVVSKIISELEK